MEGPHAKEGSVGRKCSKAFSRGRRWLERERKREQQCMQDGHEPRLDFDEGSSRGEQTVSYIVKWSHHNDQL